MIRQEYTPNKTNILIFINNVKKSRLSRLAAELFVSTFYYFEAGIADSQIYYSREYCVAGAEPTLNQRLHTGPL